MQTEVMVEGKLQTLLKQVLLLETPILELYMKKAGWICFAQRVCSVCGKEVGNSIMHVFRTHLMKYQTNYRILLLSTRI